MKNNAVSIVRSDMVQYQDGTDAPSGPRDVGYVPERTGSRVRILERIVEGTDPSD